MAALIEKVKSSSKEMASSKTETERSHLMLRDRLKQVDDQLTKTKGQLEKVLRERASLDNKLAKVVADNESFKKKVDVMERALVRGESLYKEREEDVRVLKLEVKRLRQEEANSHKTTQNMEEMKKEVLQLQKDLLQEKTKVKSLQTELENPLNIHRWRKLEGKDPPTGELIQKIKHLQKRLIARNEDIIDREMALQDKDKQLTELRAHMARQPGAEVVDEARSLKMEVQKKTKMVQSLTAERNMYMTDNLQVREKMDAMSEELHEAKRKTLDLSKKFQRAKEELMKLHASTNATTSSSSQQLPHHPNYATDGGTLTTITLIPSTGSAPSRPKRIVGGGFNLSSVPLPLTS